jgi:hypothetical protein
MSFRAFFLSLTIVAILMFSAFGTTTVYADDGTTTESTETSTPDAEEGVTPDATTEETHQPEEGDTTTVETQPEEGVTPDATTEETHQPEEGDVSVEETQQPEGDDTTTVETQPEEGVIAEGTPEPLLEQLPDNTNVTVINSEGEVEPLVTQESADAIASDYDPIWCPDGQSPIPGENGCTQSYSSFDELLTFLQTNENEALYQQAGTIYIQQGQYLGGESSVDFNNYNFNSINNYDLTLQGGWDTTANPVYTNTQFEVPITIGSSTNPWVGSLTFNNIAISGVTNQTGLTVYSESNIILSNVDVTDSQNGASLDADGYVEVSNSNFNNNQENGATIRNGGDTFINSSKFNDNGGYGLNLANSTVGAPATLDNFVTLQSVEANNNKLYGANISADRSVTVNNSFFNGNKTTSYNGYGLQVTTTYGIYITDLTAFENDLFGAHLDGASVTITGGFFNNNGSNGNTLTGRGLEVISDTFVTLDNIQANNNQLFGANIQAGNNVSLTEGFFNGNKTVNGVGYGVQIVSTNGDITVTTIEASGNSTIGAYLEGADVDIIDGIFSENRTDSLYHPMGRGLEIKSGSNVSLVDIEANNNELFGTKIAAEGDVSIVASIDQLSMFNGNKAINVFIAKADEPVGYGIQVVSTNGDISIVNIAADGNNLYGAYLEGVNVFLSDGSFTGNGETGLTITSTIATFSSVTASDNGTDGAKICADVVTVTGSTFENNDRYGLNVGSPLLVEVDNTYTNNGTAGLFSNPTCITDGDGDGDGDDPVHDDEMPNGDDHSSDPVHDDGAISNQQYGTNDDRRDNQYDKKHGIQYDVKHDDGSLDRSQSHRGSSATNHRIHMAGYLARR